MAQQFGYRKVYRLRTAVPGRKCIEVTFPYEVVEKEARSRGLTIGEFLNRFQATCEYDNFVGVIYTFEEIPTKLSQGGSDGGE
jgi:hypothetical protein